MTSEEALALLIAPLSADEFFADWFERRVYRSPEPRAAAAGLLSIDRVDEIISDSELPAGAISMAKSGASIPAREYTYGNGNVDRGAVLDNFRDGATIILPQLHFADGRLYEFCLALEHQFGTRTQTNVYLTPPGEHGFGIHFDDHDVFVIQIAGAKKWEIYGDRESLPYKGERFRKDHDDTGELRDSFVLHAGECLYVPRGTAHRAPNHGTEPSLHITVGILHKTWAEFMLEAVAEASLRIPEMRRSLPRGMCFAEAEEHAQTFRRLAQEIANTVSFEATRAAFSENFVRQQGPRVRGALNALCSPTGQDDAFVVREHILYSFENDGGSGQQIVLAGSSIPLSDELAAQLRERIAVGRLTKGEFRVADLEELDDVIGTLVAYGLLVRC